MAFSSFKSASAQFRFGFLAAMVGASALAVGCGSSDNGRSRGADGNGSGGTGTGGVILGTGSGPAQPGTGGAGLDGTGNSPGAGGGTYCQDSELNFEPQTPTVLVLVDRSSSMFQGQTQFWNSLKEAVLPVIENLQSDVRFGFASYTGSNSSCVGLSTPTPFATDNYEVVKAAYDALGAPSEKGETPTALAIEQAAELLLGDTEPGDRYILLVTDGEPDFCDDPHAPCAADALIASLQLASAKGVRTLVFGIENPDIRNPQWFDYYAQAGMGELPSWADGVQGATAGQHSGTLDGPCKGIAQWARYRTENGNAPPPDNEGCPHDYMSTPPYFCFLPAGKYSEAGGTATAFLSTDTMELANRIASTVSGLKSCTFDLGGELQIKPGSEGTGDVFINDVVLPKDQWEMTNGTVITLQGEACTLWQAPESNKFFAGFPCDVIILK